MALTLKRNLGHLYVEWTRLILFTPANLRRLHRQFKHPMAERLHAVIRRADPHRDLP